MKKPVLLSTPFPNPAVDWVRFDCSNLPQEEYTLKIYNIIGKVVWKETYQLSGNRSIRIDLDDFKKEEPICTIFQTARAARWVPSASLS
jgi:hypothetical protein